MFSIILGALLTFASLAVGGNTDLAQASSLWPLVALTGIGYVICGVGFLQGKWWAWIASVLVYGGSLAAGVIQAFMHLFVWGIFLDPIVLVYLLIPQVRGRFSRPSPPGQIQSRITVLQGLPPAFPSSKRSLRWTKGTVLTLIVMLATVSVVPATVFFVHAVSVTQVNLNIVYTTAPPGNPPFPWFGDSPRSISGPMFTWGAGRMAFRFSLTNLGLFKTHSIDSITMETPGFFLYAPGPPISIPDMALVTLSVQLQAPDYNYNGPVTIQIQTS